MSPQAIANSDPDQSCSFLSRLVYSTARETTERCQRGAREAEIVTYLKSENFFVTLEACSSPQAIAKSDPDHSCSFLSRLDYSTARPSERC